MTSTFCALNLSFILDVNKGTLTWTLNNALERSTFPDRSCSSYVCLHVHAPTCSENEPPIPCSTSHCRCECTQFTNKSPDSWSPMCPCRHVEALISVQLWACDLPPSLVRQHKAPSGSSLAHLRFQGCCSAVTVWLFFFSFSFLFSFCAVNRLFTSPSLTSLWAYHYSQIRLW